MEERRWPFVYLSKYKFSDDFIFQNDELNEICKGKFSWLDIEIIEIFGRVMAFSLIRGKEHFLVNLLFVEQSSVPLIFSSIRWPQRWVMIYLDSFPPSQLMASNRWKLETTYFVTGMRQSVKDQKVVFISDF